LNSVLAAYRDLPRAGKWGVAAALALVAYFAVVEPVIEKSAELSLRAEQRTLELTSFQREQGTGEGARAALAVGISRYGEVAWPEEQGARVDAFNRRIADVLRRHGVTGQRTMTRTASMPRGPLLDALGPGAAVTRHTNDLQFDATPEQISAILAELEKSPEVAAVSRVHLRRNDEQERARLLRANISVETWVLARKGALP
jgi:hypothetical protein